MFQFIADIVDVSYVKKNFPFAQLSITRKQLVWHLLSQQIRMDN